MKRLFLILIIPILLCGCEKKNAENEILTTESTKPTTTITTTSSTTTTTTTTQTTTTTSKKTVAKNLYTSSYDNKIHKYTYVYGDNDTCRKEGNAIFLDVADNVNKDVMVYDCEKVTASNGKEYYGLFFHTDTREDARFYY